LLVAKLVTEPFVADKVVNPVTEPPVNVTLPDVKLVTVPVVADRVVKPVTEPLVA
jgi:hypothetical protein